MAKPLLITFLFLFIGLYATAQTGHYQGQRSLGLMGGVGKGSFFGAVEGTYYVHRMYGISVTAGYEIASAFDIDENRIFLDADFMYNAYQKDSKFYLIGKAGFSFSKDETEGSEQFTLSENRIGANMGIRAEQFVSSKLIVSSQFLQRFYFDGEKRFVVGIGINLLL